MTTSGRDYIEHSACEQQIFVPGTNTIDRIRSSVMGHNQTDREPDDERYGRLRKRVAEKMNGVLYTYKVHYKIAEFYEKINTTLNLIVAAGTGALTIGLLWDSFPQKWLIALAIFVTIFSWTKSVLKLGIRSREHFDYGDEYHQLFEDFRDYVELTLLDENTNYNTKIDEFDKLSKRRNNINHSSPRTTNFWYKRLDHDKMLESIETDSEEEGLLIGGKTEKST